MHIKSFFIPLFFSNYLVAQMQYWDSPKYALSIHNLPHCYQTIRPPTKENLQRHALSITGRLNRLPIEIKRIILEYVLGNSFVTRLENKLIVINNSKSRQTMFTIAGPFYLSRSNRPEERIDNEKSPIQQFTVKELISRNKKPVVIGYSDPRVIVYHPQKDSNYQSTSNIKQIPLIIVDRDCYRYMPLGYGDYQTKEVCLPNKKGDIIILQHFAGQGNRGYIANLNEQKEKKLGSLNSNCIELEWDIKDIVLHPNRHICAVLPNVVKKKGDENLKKRKDMIHICSWNKQTSFFNILRTITKTTISLSFDDIYNHPQFEKYKNVDSPLIDDNPQYDIDIKSLAWLENNPNILTFKGLIFNRKSCIGASRNYLFFYAIENNKIAKIEPLESDSIIDCKKLECYELQ